MLIATKERYFKLFEHTMEMDDISIDEFANVITT